MKSTKQKEVKQPPLSRKDINSTAMSSSVREGSQIVSAKSKKVLQHRHVIADAANYSYADEDSVGGTRGVSNDTSNVDDYESSKVAKKKKNVNSKLSDDMLSVMDLDNWGRKKINGYAKDGKFLCPLTHLPQYNSETTSLYFL